MGIYGNSLCISSSLMAGMMTAGRTTDVLTAIAIQPLTWLTM